MADGALPITSLKGKVSDAEWQARVDLALVPQRLASAVRRVEILDADGSFTSGNYEKALRSDHVPFLLEMSV